MAYIYPFPARCPLPAAELPACLISLEDWALVNAVGADCQHYLQGQLTCDVTSLLATSHSLTAHCDGKGKMWSTLRLFSLDDGLAFLQRSSVCDQQLTELKKYAVFSKITLNRNQQAVLLGLAGHQCRQLLATLYPQLPDDNQQVIQHAETTLLYLSQPSERFIIITDQLQAERIYQQLAGQVILNNSLQWTALDIEAGLPIIDQVNSGQFLPQSTNLQVIEQAISFKKGCYSGQEMVARAKYRGANKRALYWLAGHSSRLPLAGEELELKLGDNWRRTGTVLSAIELCDQRIWVQAILSNDLESDSQLRVREQADSQLKLQPLPYSLEETA